MARMIAVPTMLRPAPETAALSDVMTPAITDRVRKARMKAAAAQAAKIVYVRIAARIR